MKKSVVLLNLFLLLTTVTYAQTNVSGAISSNTTWSLANSPYNVTGNVLVTNGVTLTIEAGTVIKVDTDLYLKVEGNILAVGSSSQPIVFESNASNGMSEWSGIRIRPTSGSTIDSNQNYVSGSQFKHVIIKNADTGIYIYNTGLHISDTEFDTNRNSVEIRATDSVVIDNSTFTNNTAGIWSEYEDFTSGDYVGNISNTYIKNSTFSSNFYGIDLITNQTDFINLNINNNLFKQNTIGIDFGGGGYGPTIHSVLISENIIYNNSNYGVGLNRVYGQATGTTANYPLEFTKNIVVDNVGGALRFESSGSVKFKIHKNILVTSVAEVNCMASTGLPWAHNHLITHNYIFSKGNNLYLGGSSSYHTTNLNFTYNLFSNPSNNEVIDIIYGSGHVFNNNNFNNISGIGYLLKNQTVNSVDAENNYWGTDTEPEIQSAIYDFTDDFELGVVDYTPFSIALNTTAPISPPSNVSKTASGSDVVLNWTTNGESDVAGYKLYYGTPTGYSYATSIDLGNTTNYIVTDGDIFTEYAITAYDTSTDGIDDIVDGNESWYSISTLNNVAPILADDAVSTDEDTSIDITLNAIDPDSTQITYAVVSNASNGTASIIDNIATYIPSVDFNGSDSFTVIANDGQFDSNVATISITVNAVNDAPVANNNTIIVDEGNSVTVLENGESSVLFNDTDAENDPLTTILVSNPNYGSLILNSNGTFSYEHDGSETTTDSFTYKSNDGFLDSNIATVSITITPINDNLPTDILLSNNSIEENLSQVVIGLFTAIDLDLPSDSHTFELVDGMGDDNNTSFTINSNNLLSNVSFDYEAQQTLSIRVKVLDANDQAFEKAFVIDVINVNDINITSNTTNSYCSGGLGTGTINITSVNQTIGVVTYNWTANNGGIIPSGQENSQNLTDLPNGTYNLSLSDDYFTYYESFEIALIPQYNDLSICYVSSDDNDLTKNRIYLNNQGNYNVAFYEILRESSVSNVYTTIGAIGSTENSFLDETSNNASQAYNYKVRLIDNCGVTSSNSDLHKTILLQSSVAVDETVNLNWSHYLGINFTTYTIFRNTNQAGFQMIGSVSANINSFNDTTADVSENNYEYYISIEVDACLNKSTGRNLDRSTEIKSNYQNIGASASLNDLISLKQISVYPNPTSSKLNIKLSAGITLVKSEIYNTLGQMIKETRETKFSIENLPSSTYFIKIFTSEGASTKRFIVK